MNKKLLAVAVAGALAAPGVALAQSSVTISGNFKASFQQYKIGNASAARAGTNTSQTLVHDDSSRIIFNMVEDLGGGLQAIGQADWRIVMDAHTNVAGSAGFTAGNPNDNVGGNTHVGLRSKAWGRIFFGQQDLHYFGRESDLTIKNDLQSDSISLLAYVAGAGVGAGGIPIAGATRTRNVVHYTTPNWGGLTAVLAYSTNPTGQELDIGSTVRKGRAWNVAPTFEARNFTVGYSYWSQKADGGGAFSDQRGDRLFGSYRWGGFKIGAAWDKSKVTNGPGVGGITIINAVTGTTTAARRTAWSLPIEYTWGPHWIGGHYTKARDDKATAVQDGARMWALGYNYSLSKRTSLGVTYATIRNDVGATYTPFTSNGALGGGPTHTALAGEDPKFWSMTIRHAF